MKEEKIQSVMIVNTWSTPLQCPSCKGPLGKYPNWDDCMKNTLDKCKRCGLERWTIPSGPLLDKIVEMIKEDTRRGE